MEGVLESVSILIWDAPMGFSLRALKILTMTANLNAIDVQRVVYGAVGPRISSAQHNCAFYVTTTFTSCIVSFIPTSGGAPNARFI